MARRQEFDVVGVGCVAVDVLAVFEGVIEEDQKMEVRQMTRQGGGLVGTGLTAVARLGGKARYVGRVGDDDDGQFVIKDFQREGVDTRCIEIVPGASVIRSIGVINPSKGFRTLYFCLQDAPEVKPSQLKRDDVLSGKVVFVDGFLLPAAIQAARWGREAGKTVLMDAEMTAPGNDELADLATHVVASLRFAQSRVGDCDAEEAAGRLFDKLAGKDPKKVVSVTAGVKGSYFVSAAGKFHQPAFKVPIVDTTGCGDVFHGSFALGLARGMDLPKIAEFASAGAALKCRKLGGRAGIPTQAEVDAFLAERR
jgi:sugar/nucleoside kinase (ribokinase family)